MRLKGEEWDHSLKRKGYKINGDKLKWKVVQNERNRECINKSTFSVPLIYIDL